MFIAYALAALTLMLTLIFIPFGVQGFRFAVFAFNPIGKEVYTPPSYGPSPDAFTSAWFQESLGDPWHPFSVAANIVWLLVFGWQLFLAHLLLAVVQFITIIGFANGVQHLKLSVFALWPFGRQTRLERPPDWPAPPYVTRPAMRETYGRGVLLGDEPAGPVPPRMEPV